MGQEDGKNIQKIKRTCFAKKMTCSEFFRSNPNSEAHHTDFPYRLRFLIPCEFITNFPHIYIYIYIHIYIYIYTYTHTYIYIYIYICVCVCVCVCVMKIISTCPRARLPKFHKTALQDRTGEVG